MFGRLVAELVLREGREEVGDGVELLLRRAVAAFLRVLEERDGARATVVEAKQANRSNVLM